MPLKEEVVSRPGEAIRRTRTEVPDYIQQAIAESVRRGQDDARSASLTPRKPTPTDSTSD